MSTVGRLKPRLSWLPQWRVWLCVLLIVLVVYNPFGALSGSSASSCYEKLARNRASIGASELQHFSPTSSPDLRMELDMSLRSVELPRCIQETQAGCGPLEVIAYQPALLFGVWFRPPPSL